MDTLIPKLRPDRFPGMSPFMAAVVGYDLRNNWNRLLDAAGLTPDERADAVALFNERVERLPGTGLR